MTTPVLERTEVRCAVSGCTHVAAGTVVDLDESRALPVCASHFADRTALLDA